MPNPILIFGAVVIGSLALLAVVFGMLEALRYCSDRWPRATIVTTFLTCCAFITAAIMAGWQS